MCARVCVTYSLTQILDCADREKIAKISYAPRLIRHLPFGSIKNEAEEAERSCLLMCWKFIDYTKRVTIKFA